MGPKEGYRPMIVAGFAGFAGLILLKRTEKVYLMFYMGWAETNPPNPANPATRSNPPARVRSHENSNDQPDQRPAEICLHAEAQMSSLWERPSVRSAWLAAARRRQRVTPNLVPGLRSQVFSRHRGIRTAVLDSSKPLLDGATV